jgi:vancomycin permeability regulator SanA
VRVAIVSILLLSIPFIISLSYILYHYSNEASEKREYGVIFGAKVWSGGVPSHSLYDRTATGIELLKSGLVDKLILSGGYSDSGYWEAEVMLDMVLKSGVSRDRVVIDNRGVNSIATLKNLPKDGTFTLVSNDFHLGRLQVLSNRLHIENIQLQRAKYHYGRYIKEFYFLFREVIALLYYTTLYSE